MVEKPHGAFDLAFDMIRAGGQLIAGRAPKPERMVSPGMKKIAKGIGDVAIFGWNRSRK
jgi:hypothetical protein